MPLPLVISTHELTASDYASLEGLCELLQPDPGQSFSKADLLAMDRIPMP